MPAAAAPADAATVESNRESTETPDGAVKVSVSPEAQALADKAHASRDDEAKIERLRAAVQNGTLTVDPAAIAEKIVGKV